MKAIDVLPILKEKVAFLSGQKTWLRLSQHTHKDRQSQSGSIAWLLTKTHFCVLASTFVRLPYKILSQYQDIFDYRNARAASYPSKLTYV